MASAGVASAGGSPSVVPQLSGGTSFSRGWVQGHIERGLPDDLRLRRMVGLLLLDPVTWDGHSPTVSNGQHRIAQARVEGIPKLPVVHP